MLGEPEMLWPGSKQALLTEDAQLLKQQARQARQRNAPPAGAEGIVPPMADPPAPDGGGPDIDEIDVAVDADPLAEIEDPWLDGIFAAAEEAGLDDEDDDAAPEDLLAYVGDQKFSKLTQTQNYEPVCFVFVFDLLCVDFICVFGAHRNSKDGVLPTETQANSTLCVMVLYLCVPVDNPGRSQSSFNKDLKAMPKRSNRHVKRSMERFTTR